NVDGVTIGNRELDVLNVRAMNSSDFRNQIVPVVPSSVEVFLLRTTAVIAGNAVDKDVSEMRSKFSEHQCLHLANCQTISELIPVLGSLFRFVDFPACMIPITQDMKN